MTIFWYWTHWKPSSSLLTEFSDPPCKVECLPSLRTFCLRTFFFRMECLTFLYILCRKELPRMIGSFMLEETASLHVFFQKYVVKRMSYKDLYKCFISFSLVYGL